MFKYFTSPVVLNFIKHCRTFSSEVKATALFQFHQENGGKIVNFGGYYLPVQYKDQSITQSHLFTRSNASLFDVSHMLQTEIQGTDCVKYLETLCTADLKNLSENASVLTVFTNECGGILDDLIITKISNTHLYIVSNAARKEHDQNHLITSLDIYKKEYGINDLNIRFFDPSERSLIALQGPKAASVLQKLTSFDLSRLYFMNSTVSDIVGIKNCRITRCGYTGEDGFEISLPSKIVSNVAKEILNSDDVKLAGLGARDSLRLEAGLCLYGNDINSETTPVDAALTWLVAKRRRNLKNFPGALKIIEQIETKSLRKRVGFISEAGPPARQGSDVVSEDGLQTLGFITSGCPSPTLNKNIAMGYISTNSSKPGTQVNLKIRGKLYKAFVRKMPFVNTNYYNKPK